MTKILPHGRLREPRPDTPAVGGLYLITTSLRLQALKCDGMI